MNVSGKHYKWMLFDGAHWISINNDHIIEANYCQPEAKGITLHTTDGSLHIDFLNMKVVSSSSNHAVKRETFLSEQQREDVGWYYRDNSYWCEYGTGHSSVDSQILEQWYNSNPSGSFLFSVGSTNYTIDFSAMMQTNMSTQMKRDVRRRPKFISTASAVPNSQGTTPSINPSSGFTWEFMGDKGTWTAYQKPSSSLDSVDIERQFQLNPQGQITFTAGSYSYTLNFSGMYQINQTFGTRRNIRRISSGIPSNSRTSNGARSYTMPTRVPRSRQFTGSASATFTPSINPFSGITWEFMGNEGVWMAYQKPSSSLDSVDIERQFQLNPQGQITITAGSYSYTLNFSGMYQTNLTFGTRRNIRRISSENLSNSSQFNIAPSATSTPFINPFSGITWEFMGNEGVWMAYQKPSSSLDSVDIERQFQLNPQGQITFTAGSYSYTLNFSGMYQTNQTFGTRRTVRRISSGNPYDSSTSSEVCW